MKKILLPILILFLSVSVIFAQQPPNPSFEEWEDAGTVVDEPVNWSSIKTSDGGEFINNAAAQVWEQSTDAHHGNFSVKLTNVALIILVPDGKPEFLFHDAPTWYPTKG